MQSPCGFGNFSCPLRQTKSGQRWLVNRRGWIKTMIALIICDRGPCQRSEKTVHSTRIISLRLQRGLDIGNYLTGIQAIVSVDRPVVGIICILVVAPRWVPVVRIPEIPSTEYEYYARVMAPPPNLIMPLGGIISKHHILRALPVLAVLNAIACLKLHILDRRIRFIRQVEMLGFERGSS